MGTVELGTKGFGVNAKASASAAAPRKSAALAAPTMLQLLGFVFASADVVLEISGDGEVAFATGAIGPLIGRSAEALNGVSWRELVDAADADLLEAAIRDLKSGERRGPFKVNLSGARSQTVKLSLFQMPQRPDRVSVALSRWDPEVGDLPVDASGMASREDFEAAAVGLLKTAERAGLPLHLDLLEFAGLSAALDAMAPPAAEELQRKLAAALRAASFGGLPAASLGPDRYAVVRSGSRAADALTPWMQEAAGPSVTVSSGELKLDTTSPVESLRAIRYALDRCIEEGPPAAAKRFEAAFRQTVSESNRFKDLLRNGRFELVYQPVVDLKTRELHHYEALTRFEGGGGPAGTIKLAEELGLVVELDLAIVRSVVDMLRESPVEVSVAANVSAFSLQSQGFVNDILQATSLTPKLRPRLLLEITESHKIVDLEGANALIQTLRAAGHVVCLDDFGAGAASLDYLRALETDVVKFDGRFVQALARSRDATILRRLAELCRELGVTTIAEMIETEETAKVVADLGIDYGQGWLFGKPVNRPVAINRTGPVAARRKGEVESWG